MMIKSRKHEFEDIGTLLLESRKLVCIDNDTILKVILFYSNYF
jgi:hypothetical protein